MPTYELALMIRAMPKPELRTTLQRISHHIFNRGGIIRNIENLGFRPMPYRSSAHGIVHKEANYFVFKINTPTQTVIDLKEEYARDVDIIRRRIFKTNEYLSHDCTLEDELIPPAYRKEVQKMVEIGKTQIQAEHQAALNYMNLAVHFLNPLVSRPGAGGFFMNMFEEEMGHMKAFIQYQLSRGGNVVICGVCTPEHPCELSLLQAFTLGLELERNITMMLEQTILLAEEQKDHRTADHITSVFMEEQMQSLQEMMHHVTKLSRLCDEHALYHYDLNLLKSHPYSFKTK